jgi:pyruvate/2-oxoglutarate dehydrogenase complex dihydrolipoamide dehydrogenase (E3) component
MYDITLIGYGVAHMSLLLALSDRSLKVCVVDPFFDGGDLRRRWATVQSNTTWQQFLDAIEPFVSKVKYEALRQLHDPTKTTQLGELVGQYAAVVSSATQHFIKVFGTVVQADWTADHWTLTLSTGSQIKSKVISYSPGAEPRQLNFQCPVLTLETALSDRISAIIRPHDHVLVFGLSHSGTLAAAAALRLGAKVSAVYQGEEPFQFARDGRYNGIKQESAAIADNILETGSVDLIRADDHIKVCNAVMSATWVVYAVGFEPRKTVKFTVDGEPVEPTYDSTTGRLEGLKDAVAYGFGIAWPNSNIVDGKTYYDVSLAAFLKHCCANNKQIM